jgi:hypothetical protein
VNGAALQQAASGLGEAEPLMRRMGGHPVRGPISPTARRIPGALQGGGYLG